MCNSVCINWTHCNSVLVNPKEQESALASEQRCLQLETAQCELELQLSGLSDRLEEEEACSAQLILHRDRLEAECSILRRDLDELEGALTSTEQSKQVELYVSLQELMMTDWRLNYAAFMYKKRSVRFKRCNCYRPHASMCCVAMIVKQ